MVEEGKFLLNKDTGEEIDIKQEDFEFVQIDKKIHDVKFSKKATTFFKDALKRFVKSKSAVGGGIIVGILALFALIVPFAMPNIGAYNVDRDSAGGNVAERLIQPKLFPSGTGFWDGTIKKTKILFNTETNTPNGYREGVYTNLVTYEAYENSANALGKGGYVNVYALASGQTGNFSSPSYTFNLDNDYSFTTHTGNEDVTGYKLSTYQLYFDVSGGSSILLSEGTITDESYSVNLTEKLKAANLEDNTVIGKIRYLINAVDDGAANILIKDAILTSNNDSEQEALKNISFESANEVLLRDSSSQYRWTTTSGRNAYKVEYVYCDFTYDQYEDVYGVREYTYSTNDLLKLEVNGQLEINFTNTVEPATSDKTILNQRYKVNDTNAIVEIIEQVGDATYNRLTNSYTGFSLKCKVQGFSLYGYSSRPLFIFGTNTNRKDYFKLICTGLRFSLLLAIGVSAVNIIIGLIWGSISGYFGGWTDILMERFCEILSGIPGTVVITLCILYGSEWKRGSASDVIALIVALFLTGWMGVAARTRTQFYRFKGREYVLASRTLGAKDSRLIFKHILPNSMGTIITGSILMIPGVIYTEASIAYLQLGLQGQVMFGVILSEANSYYTGESTYILIIPTILMAFLLVSFNMFGNGLRDAFNPALKGSE